MHELHKIARSTKEYLRASSVDQLLALPTGDGMALVFFGDPEAPVRCAVEVSRAISINSEIKLRMGVHSGPVARVLDFNANRAEKGRVWVKTAFTVCAGSQGPMFTYEKSLM